MSSHLAGPPRSATGFRAIMSASAAAIVTLGIAWPTSIATSTFAEAKTPGKTYCFYRVCHRVMTLEETRRAMGKRMVLVASHYDDPKKDRFNPTNLTSSGEWFRAGVPDNAASPKLPNGTVVLAWNPATRQSTVLRINNAGPYWGNRTLDVSRAAAERLGFARQGVATLHVQILHAATREDVAYKKGRRYAAVPGHIGAHASFELALADAGRLMGSPTVAPTTVIASIAPPATLQPLTILQAESAIVAEPATVAAAAVAAADTDPIVTGTTTPAARTAETAKPAPGVIAAARPKQPRKPQVAARPAQLRSLTVADPYPVVTTPRRAKPNPFTTTTTTITTTSRPRQAKPVLSATRTPLPRNAVVASRQSLVAVDDDDDEIIETRPVRAARTAAAPAARRTAAPRAAFDYGPAACRGSSLSCELVGSPRAISASSKRP